MPEPVGPPEDYICFHIKFYLENKAENNPYTITHKIATQPIPLWYVRLRFESALSRIYHFIISIAIQLSKFTKKSQWTTNYYCKQSQRAVFTAFFFGYKHNFHKVLTTTAKMRKIQLCTIKLQWG